MLCRRSFGSEPFVGVIIVKLKKFSRDAADEPHRADLLAEGYVTWRTASSAVAESYRSWNRADRDERSRAHAAYLAALDREEHAAAAYRHLIERSEPG